MEVEVRAVGGIESCFASLPLSLIDALDRTSGGFLPALLPFELRPLAADGFREHRPWFLAWSGSASKSNSIEISQQLSDCYALPSGTKALFKVVPHLPKAEFVNIEPISENDWEILELNSELAEEAILKQVGIVYEGMKFPLWLHGHNVVEFLVISSSPKKSIVQLVPGTEVAVAPKRRKEIVGPNKGIQKQNSTLGMPKMKALLRVQATEQKHVYMFEFRGFEISVSLTCVVLVHPSTAENFTFENLQFVMVHPKILPKESIQRDKNGYKKVDMFPNKERSRHIYARILFSDSVAKGHVMLSQSLCHFLGAHVHSWVYVRKYSAIMKEDIPVLTVTPCFFNAPKSQLEENVRGEGSGQDAHSRPGGIGTGHSSTPKEHLAGSLYHEELVASMSRESVSRLDDIISDASIVNHEFLLKSWLVGQLKALRTYIGQTEISSIILPLESLLHFEIKNCTLGNRTVELLYLLSASDGKSQNSDVNGSFELVLNTSADNPDELDFDIKKLEQGKPIFIDLAVERCFSKTLGFIPSSSWMKTSISDVTDRLLKLLSLSSRKWFSKLDCPLPGNIIVYGPPGCGKTTLMKAASKYLEDDKDILAHITYINCSKLAVEKNLKVQQAIAEYLSEALQHSPSVVVFDDLDNIISSSSEPEGSRQSSHATSLVKYLTDVMDECRDKSQNFCGYGPIAFMASVRSLENLPHALTSSGMFDFHVELLAPAAPERTAILEHEICKRHLQCSVDVLSEIASKCDGYDAYDLETLVDRAVHAAIICPLPADGHCRNEKATLLKDDFLKAMHDFVPVAMRGLKKANSEAQTSGWEDVGGLSEARNVIQETIELPSKFANIFSKAPLRLRTNILLYGPPGCGKTHIVGAAASAASLRFISIKGPELLNKYIGASEQAVRDVFARAAAAAPCVLFFDEFDSIAPKRGHDNTGVTDRVVNQLLTELDGVETLTGVFVFAATSRPDLLDAALLRPGRFDRLVFCDFPQRQERLDILSVLSRKLNLDSDVNLEEIAFITEGFSGADLRALLSDAELAAINELLNVEENDRADRRPVINNNLLISEAFKARPSISDREKQRLYAIYNEFTGSKKSISAQARDSKGKRATLA